jgi:hypothetical protein
MKLQTSKPRTFILSAFRDDATKRENRNAHAELSCDLALLGVPFQEATGCWRGKRELAYVIVGNDSHVRHLARIYGQECYVAISENDRGAYLVRPDADRWESIGKLVYHGEQEPTCDSWTCVDGCYYVTQPPRGIDLDRGF